MKTSVLSFVCAIAASFFFTTKIDAQASCPNISNGSFRIITNPSNPCLRQATFNYTNPTSGAKRINVKIIVGATLLIEDCIDASGQVGVTRTYLSANFSACNISDIRVQVTPYTGSNCSSSACSATLMSIGGAPLPVTFASFNADRNGTTVNLKWETATEINNTGFAVERNINGNWEQIAFVASLAVNGNSSEKLRYQFADFNASKSVSQYRLRQIDYNGQFDYSAIRAITGIGQDVKTIVYPNPSVNGRMNVVFGDAASRDIIVSDMAGRVIRQWSGYNGNSLEITGLSTGMFSLQVYNRETSTRSSEKLMVTGK